MTFGVDLLFVHLRWVYLIPLVKTTISVRFTQKWKLHLCFNLNLFDFQQSAKIYSQLNSIKCQWKCAARKFSSTKLAINVKRTRNKLHLEIQKIFWCSASPMCVHTHARVPNDTLWYTIYFECRSAISGLSFLLHKI